MSCLSISSLPGQYVQSAQETGFSVFPVVPGMKLALVGLGKSCDEELIAGGLIDSRVGYW